MRKARNDIKENAESKQNSINKDDMSHYDEIQSLRRSHIKGSRLTLSPI